MKTGERLVIYMVSFELFEILNVIYFIYFNIFKYFIAENNSIWKNATFAYKSLIMMF